MKRRGLFHHFTISRDLTISRNCELVRRGQLHHFTASRHTFPIREVWRNGEVVTADITRDCIIETQKRHHKPFAVESGNHATAWRELDADELDEVTGETRAQEQADIGRLVDLLKEKPLTWTEARKDRPSGMTTRQFDAAWKAIINGLDKYGLDKAEVQTSAKQRRPVYYGLPGAVKTAAVIALRNWKNATGEA